MKGLKITWDNKFKVVDVNLESLSESVDGYIEHVFPQSEFATFISTLLGKNVHFVCDEEYTYKKRSDQVNWFASDLYGQYILGNIVLISFPYGSEDFDGFEQENLEKFIVRLETELGYTEE